MATTADPDLRHMPELLTQLSALVAQTLSSTVDLDPDVGHHVGHEVSRRLAEAWGGAAVYIPKADSLQRYDRDLQIWADFTGNNHVQLARKYRISVVWVYSICKRMRALDVERRQGKLPLDVPPA